jgi:retron-type reverse transcriptase
MIEKVIDRKNLRQVAQHVKANKGSAGVDGMGVSELTSYLKMHRDKLCSDIVLGNYLPQPIVVIDLKNCPVRLDHLALAHTNKNLESP